METSPPDHDPIRPGSLRSPTGRGRPYPDEIVVAVRALIEGTGLRFGEIAERTGIGEATVGRWARRSGWRRPDGNDPVRGPAGHGRSTATVQVGNPDDASRTTYRHLARVETPPGRRPKPPRHGAGRDAARVERGPTAACDPGLVPPVPRVNADRVRESRRYGRYGAAEREAARALIEGSLLGLERIGISLGIATATLFRWKKRFRWSRPPAPERPGPWYYRSRRLRGRPYSTDAVETARQLVICTLLPQKRIAARAGVSQASVSNWIARRGWTRPRAKPGSHRFAAARRTAPTVASGDRRGRGYDPKIVAAAREMYAQTMLSTIIIAARVKVSAVTVARWAKLKGWTRPSVVPDSYGQSARFRSARRSRSERTSRAERSIPPW